jgi:two-component system OmpR family response regulator
MSKGESNNQRILVVDDESSISDLISTSLRFVGFDVRTANNGSQALLVAEEFKPHAMVLDVMMPGMVLKFVSVFATKVKTLASYF